MVTAMLLIDEGELGSGLHQETVEDTEAASILPDTYKDKLSLRTVPCMLEFVRHTHGVGGCVGIPCIKKFLNDLI